MKPAIVVAFASSILFSMSTASQAQEPCWSVLRSKFGPDIKAAVDKADPCKNVPGGFDVKKSFTVDTLDLCTAPNGVMIKSKATLECRTGDNAFIKTSIRGDAEAELVLDIGACKITDSKISIGGRMGQIASLQKSIRDLAQKAIDDICRPTN